MVMHCKKKKALTVYSWLCYAIWQTKLIWKTINIKGHIRLEMIFIFLSTSDRKRHKTNREWMNESTGQMGKDPTGLRGQRSTNQPNRKLRNTKYIINTIHYNII